MSERARTHADCFTNPNNCWLSSLDCPMDPAKKKIKDDEQMTVLIFPVVEPVEDALVECPQCFSVVKRGRAQEHYDWHSEAGKKMDRAGSPFGSLFGSGGPL